MRAAFYGFFSRLSLAIAGVWFSLVPANALAAQTIEVSIAPLHSIVSAVADGVHEPALLIPPGQSPHTMQLKASTVRRLSGADIIFIVDLHFETSLTKAIAALDVGARVHSAGKAPGIRVLPFRDGGDGGHHHHHHLVDQPAAAHETVSQFGSNNVGFSPEETDWHIWLDPQNAIAIADHVVAVLSAKDPENAAVFEKNAQTFAARLSAVSQSTNTQLQGFGDETYIVFHDAYQYFDTRFGLAPPLVVSLHPERPPGAKRIRELRERIKTEKVRCLFSEPQFTSPIIETLVEDLPVKVGRLDPMGVDFDPGLALYPALIGQLSSSFADCLVKS